MSAAVSAKQTRQWRSILMGFINQLRIISRDDSGSPLEVGVKIDLWRSQQRIVDEIAAGMQDGIRQFLVLKSRQLGSTTICEIVILLWLALHAGIKAAIVVDQEKTREKIREELRGIVASIPPAYFGGKFAIKPGADNRYTMGFTNGSLIDFLVAGVSGTKDAWGESSGYSACWLTEVANYGSEEGLNNFEEALSEKNPTRLYLYESTAKGYNHWRDRWLDGRNDPYTTRCIFVGWWGKDSNELPRTDPRFYLYGAAPPSEREAQLCEVVQQRYGWHVTAEQLAWYRMRQSSGKQSEGNLQQNQPWIEEQAFVQSGKSFFQVRQIAKDFERLTTEQVKYQGCRFWLGNEFWGTKVEWITEQVRQHEIELRMWHPPMPAGEYVIGADPAGGSDEKNDRHCGSVWRCYADKLVQVAEYADNMADTRQFAWVLAYLAGIYSTVMVTLELSGGYGKAVMAEWTNLQQMLRADIYRERRSTGGKDLSEFLDNARWYVYRRTDTPIAGGYSLNWITSNDNKNEIFSGFRDSHVNNLLEINSKPLLEEMVIITQDKSSIGAPGNTKDDRTFAGCLANHAWRQHFRPTLLMAGDTYAAVTAREAADRPGAHIVDQIVSQYLRQAEAGVTEEPTAARSWMMERGLI